VPALAAIDELRLDAPVTLLAGENGAGKSTILELVAEAIGFAPQGGELERLGELPAVPRSVLNGALSPILSTHKPRKGYYLRAESFFNVAEFVDSGGRYAPDLSLYGDVPLHRQSHGESFLALAANRFGGDGVYLLDEPEAALSVTGSLAVLAVIVRAARGRAVRGRDTLTHPACMPRRTDRRAQRHRHRSPSLRRPRRRAADARLPRRARALPARRAQRLRHPLTVCRSLRAPAAIVVRALVPQAGVTLRCDRSFAGASGWP
jgi:hypothetical protein